MRTTLDVLYSQFLVCDAQLELPFNDWTDAHAAQGFSWRPGSVAFMTLETGGTMQVEVLTAVSQSRDLGAASRVDPKRCIVVPFHVPAHGQCALLTVIQTIPIQLLPGEYELTFEHGSSPSGEMWTVLRFEPVAHPVQARVVTADSELNPPDELLMTAQPA